MAKEKINLDQFFKEKLIQDSIKPSKLAWERLESELPQKENKRSPLVWWAAAASVGILFMVGYLTLQNNSVEQSPDFLAVETQEIPAAPENVIPEITSEKNSEDPVATELEPKNSATIQSEPKQSEKNKTIEKPTSSTSQNLIAQAEEKSVTQESSALESTEIIVEPIDVPALKMPNLQTNQAVAEVIEKPESGEPSYSVKIYSDGIKAENDNNLISEIGKKVEKVEGLLGKVDQGFADLQDAKNNLFASLLTKKEKVAEKP